MLHHASFVTVRPEHGQELSGQVTCKVSPSLLLFSSLSVWLPLGLLKCQPEKHLLPSHCFLRLLSCWAWLHYAANPRDLALQIPGILHVIDLLIPLTMKDDVGTSCGTSMVLWQHTVQVLCAVLHRQFHMLLLQGSGGVGLQYVSVCVCVCVCVSLFCPCYM